MEVTSTLKVNPLPQTSPKKLKPPKFRLIQNLAWARPATYVPSLLTSKRRYTGVRKQGIKYEQAALKFLQLQYGELFIAQPWFCYQEQNESRIRYCQPDALLYSDNLSTVTIVEIKLKHTEIAWWQLRHKYAPLIRSVHPNMEIRLVEFVKWYDVEIPFPEPVELRRDIRHAKRDTIQVTIWKP